MLGFLLLSGFLIRRVELAGRQSAELLGPGDLIRPYEVEGDEYEMVPSQASWQVLSPARLAVLDERFVRRTRGDPELLERLLARMLRRSQTLALRLALVQLPNLTARLHFLLWHLADRFGRVEPSGVLLALPLSHANLAELVSAQRPSVSRAMKRLEREGLISPANDCGWLLGGPAPKSPSEPVAASIRRSNGRR